MMWKAFIHFYFRLNTSNLADKFPANPLNLFNPGSDK